MSKLDFCFKEKFVSQLIPVAVARKRITIAILSVLWALTLIQCGLHVYVLFKFKEKDPSPVTFIVSLVIFGFQSLSLYMVCISGFFD